MEIIVIIAIVFGAIHMFKKYRKAAGIAIIQDSSEAIAAYKKQFLAFRNVTYAEFTKHLDASDITLDDYDRLLFMRYLVEANEAAMERFGIHSILKNDLNVIMLGELKVPDSYARGILHGLKLNPLRGLVTNEVLDDLRGAGDLAYREWLNSGDEVAITKAAWLWTECNKAHDFRNQLAAVGIRFD